MASFATLTPFLIWLLCIGIAALVIGLLIKSMNFRPEEGFSSSIVITTCPSATTNYVTSKGSTNCCNGDVVDGKCNGEDICSLSASDPSGGIISCAEWIIKEWQKRSDRFCAPSMPYYFGTMRRRQGDIEGCSASKTGPDGSKPQDTTKPTCKIYKSSVDEYGKPDSCFNVRARDAMVAPISNATKQIIPVGNKNPALLSATYSPPNGISVVPVACYDWDRAKIFLNSIDPTGNSTKSYEKIKDKHVIFCGASKAYYVNGSLAKKDAIGV